MPLTHDFKETIRARAQAEPEFRQALLREAIECIINGDLATGKAVLRDYVNATVGFQGLEKADSYPRKEPDAHARAQGKPVGRKPFPDHDGSAAHGRGKVFHLDI